MATATIKFIEDVAIIPDGTCDQDTTVFLGTVTFSAAADTYLTNGLLAASGFDLKSMGPYADRSPMSIYIYSIAGSGWQYQWVQSTLKMKIFSGNSSGSATTAAAELPNATALNAATPNIFTDVVRFEARFPRR